MQLIQIHEPGQSPLPHEDTRAVGIDLGTTNSLVAISDGNRQVLTDAMDQALLPSVVAFDSQGVVAVGQAAEARMADNQVEVIRSIKRLMGKGKGDIKTLAGALPFELDADKKGALALSIFKRKVTPVEVSAEILKALKQRAETALGKAVDKAVITVPAYFDDAARTATKDAARLAGLEVLRLINEPTAAALAYGLDNASEGIYAVYDLGGGTFDISLLKMQKGVFKVLATGGDNMLGGDDFDRVIAESFLKKAGVKETLSPRELGHLLVAARKAKEELTAKASGTWQVRLGKKEASLSLTRKEFNHLIEAEIKRTITICRSVLEDAHLAAADIKGVVMVGGSTRVPLVKEKVSELFGKRLFTDVDPEKVVALGAAAQAEALTRGSENLLLDVTPLSLGLETMGGLVEKIIYRNTPIPVAKSQEFTTYKDNQGGMVIHVLQGEREMVPQCRSLAKFELKGIPPMPAGIPRIKVTFTIDADGLLMVSAREQTTGKEQTVEVKPSYGLAPEQIEEMLKESITHAREDITQRLLAESRVEADVAIRTVESAVANDGDLLDKDSREKINRQVAFLRNAMKKTNRDAIDAGIRDLEKVSEAFAENRVNRALRNAVKGKTVKQMEGGLGGKKRVKGGKKNA